MDPNPLPPIEFLEECFSYNEDNGIVVWKHRPISHFPKRWVWQMWNKKFSGKEAGGVDQIGYRQINIKPKIYRTHRIIWKLMTGKDPVNEIDHVNGNGLDNRWANLRMASRIENSCNRGAQRNSSLGLKGVYFHQRDQSFIARITLSGRTIQLGRFKDAQSAHAAYRQAAVVVHGVFAKFSNKQEG